MACRRTAIEADVQGEAVPAFAVRSGGYLVAGVSVSTTSSPLSGW